LDENRLSGTDNWKWRTHRQHYRLQGLFFLMFTNKKLVEKHLLPTHFENCPI